MTTQEFHAHRGQPVKRDHRYCTPDDDRSTHFHQYDEEAGTWTLDVYHERHAQALVRMGCKPLPCVHGDGKLFALDTRQLIQFLADSEEIAIEFRKRKKRTMTEEQREELVKRMKRINAERNGALI